MTLLYIIITIISVVIGVSSNEALLVNDRMQKKTASLDAEYTWMLKSPFHLPYLEELFATFPDATVIWTHRDPAECIASACSLYWHLMSMATESERYAAFMGTP